MVTTTIFLDQLDYQVYHTLKNYLAISARTSG